MSRILPAAALLLGLAAAPAFAQGSPAPEDPSARTLQQNQRAFIPTPARPQPRQAEAVKQPPVAALPPAVARRFAQAEPARR
ncbi:hypothetical protein [Paracraurococcus lichenis]|uniref:Uncharacterized protein n=1 Tax=Paracraurococcus lichenis TaxID=3064888 RepID=A0ABT9E2V4_9PROT|nr:hypothetical protein [Paracraurococcus sp. LOR1-02]MDO9710497.1 hypothetical protein [Paracraurococcus sp. LOR1-02]